MPTKMYCVALLWGLFLLKERSKKEIYSALIHFHESGTCAHWEIGNVLIADDLFIWDTVCEKSQSRATHDSYLWPVSRPAQQPFCSQFAVIKGTAAESGERKILEQVTLITAQIVSDKIQSENKQSSDYQPMLTVRNMIIFRRSSRHFYAISTSYHDQISIHHIYLWH